MKILAVHSTANRDIGRYTVVDHAQEGAYAQLRTGSYHKFL